MHWTQIPCFYEALPPFLQEEGRVGCVRCCILRDSSDLPFKRQSLLHSELLSASCILGRHTESRKLNSIDLFDFGRIDSKAFVYAGWVSDPILKGHPDSHHILREGGPSMLSPCDLPSHPNPRALPTSTSDSVTVDSVKRGANRSGREQERATEMEHTHLVEEEVSLTGFKDNRFLDALLTP